MDAKVNTNTTDYVENELSDIATGLNVLSDLACLIKVACSNNDNVPGRFDELNDQVLWLVNQLQKSVGDAYEHIIAINEAA